MPTLDDFDFTLPSELIAQHPAHERTASRLLVVSEKALTDCGFSDLPRLLSPGDLLVFNDTRVIRARLFGKKESGGALEAMIERIVDSRRAIAQIRASHPPKVGGKIRLENALTLSVTRAKNGFYDLELEGEGDLHDLVETYGHLPLPPYITREATPLDEARYQSVYAKNPGAVAAPTAGLHFDHALFSALSERGLDFSWLTLHVGAGTFQPVRGEISEHRMHTERFEIPQDTVDAVLRTQARKGRVIAVGTTSLRALESASRGGTLLAGAGETDLFITPGYSFKVADSLITNFHLPKSTLFMLVCAFAGCETLHRAYSHAIEKRYRFFSYGDAMLLSRTQNYSNTH